ncbi:exopolysaccharide biosynthesis polyprenyl glycosylphosphotransferase [Nocardioides nitrophenolicus]|uniref:exopolysaccharide biosynthesis polyprenyl glycosylphosphotransferase n=1 Tax=Nocardioides nitrophenolicus TaxID=60489 RepID=UPI001956B1C8|nr:exopolysaccharide biosynthesis polyprenyl glycosylphosphotransferase [Nocardioides nitrophenolicus]MBM7518313.1 exopolysaccharide biosynthesis polyprenyl glycosylphosphotransferase [Nocardioides nitrophenolicus]
MTVLSARTTVTPAEHGGSRATAPLHRAGRMRAAADALAALVVVLVASLVPDAIARVGPALLFVPMWVAAVCATGDYQLPGHLGARCRRLAVAALVLPTGALLVADLVGYPLSAGTVAAVCALSALLGGAARGTMAVLARSGVRLSGVTHRVVVAGTVVTLPALVERLGKSPAQRFEVVGACDLASCVARAADDSADAVILAPDPTVSAADLQRLCWCLEDAGVAIFVWTGLLTSPAGRTRLDLGDQLPLLHLGAPRRLGPSHAVKHLLDRVLATLALLLLAPLLLALALAIRLDSPGPAFFRQTRIGRADAPFTIWKLRTMRCDADLAEPDLVALDEGSGPLFKIHRDPRITRVGRWLRRTSLDELPQLINVALGQMSLVGPRPALPSEVAAYLPDVRHRLVVRPGMTGLWQVSGRSDLSWDDTVRLDQQYVDNWSLLLDAKILLRTAGAVLSGRGAY